MKGKVSLTVGAGSQAKRKVGKATKQGKQRRGKGSVKEENVVGGFNSGLFGRPATKLPINKYLLLLIKARP